jgi:hypothetical protein
MNGERPGSEIHSSTTPGAIAAAGRQTCQQPHAISPQPGAEHELVDADVRRERRGRVTDARRRSETRR